jgi:hypothetical protein
LPWRARRRRSITNAHGSNSSKKDFAIGPVPIADQIARGPLPAARLRDLICDPFCGRMRVRMGGFPGRVRRSIMICCLKIRISASSATRDRSRSITIPKISLHKSNIEQQHGPISDQRPAGWHLRQGQASYRHVHVGRADYWTTSSLTFATPPPTIPSVSAAA